MKAPERCRHQFRAPRGEGVPELKILIVFENERLSREAMRTCTHLMATFDRSFTYQIALGSFATLEVPAKFGEYLQASQHADLVFCVSDSPVPGTARRWISECIRKHQRGDFALVDMTSEGLMEAGDIQDALKTCPQHLHADLIRQTWARQRNHTDTSSSWHIARPCHGPHFGINE